MSSPRKQWKCANSMRYSAHKRFDTFFFSIATRTCRKSGEDLAMKFVSESPKVSLRECRLFLAAPAACCASSTSSIIFYPTSAIWEFPLFKLTFKYLKHFKESDDAWKWKIFGSKFYANFMQFKMVISALFAFDLLHSIQNISSSMCNKSFYAFSS